MLNYDDIIESSVLNENSLSTAPNMTTGSAGDSRYMWGIEYNIVPLSRNLDQKGNDTKHIKKYSKIFRDDIYPGQEVSGYSVRDHERHTGKIFSFVYSHRHPDMLQAVVIIDSKTQTQVRLLPHSVEKVDMSKKLINMRNVIELDKIRQQSRVDIIDSIGSERLIESAGETESDMEDLLDMTPEELMYRDELIEMLSLDEKTIRYMDIKFSGEKFSSNYMIVSKVPYFVTRLLGAPDNNRNQDYVREFLQLYSDMTHQDKDFEKYDSIYTNNDYLIR